MEFENEKSVNIENPRVSEAQVKSPNSKNILDSLLDGFGGAEVSGGTA